MTEAEAKTKWCPFSRNVSTSYHTGTVGNRPQTNEVNCLGTGCMLWLGTPEDGRCGMSEKN